MIFLLFCASDSKGPDGTSLNVVKKKKENGTMAPNEPSAQVPGPSGSAGLSMVTVQMRVPEFWTDMPKLWFAQFESIMAPQKQSEAVKFDMVVAKLSRDAIRQVGDLIQAPPENGRYAKLKEQLLAIYEESADSQFQRLVGDMDLGTQKPSQLFRKMGELARNSGIPEAPLRRLWIARLPPSVRAILAGSEDTKLESLVKLADRIVENMSTGEIAAASSEPTKAVADKQTEVLAEMLKELQKLRVDIDEVRERQRSTRRDPSAWRRQRSVSRSRSTARRSPGDPGWLCRYHYRFGEKARSCESPCSWAQGQNRTEN